MSNTIKMSLRLIKAWASLMKASRRYKARRLHKSATSFICAVNGNDVLAMLEMMLTYGQMMLYKAI